MSGWLRQVRAWLSAEWLRQATSPTWAVLLVVWTLVCGLFFQVVVAHLSRNELPAGESPMSFFFRATPWLLPMLLVVFLPHLATDAIAGRRATGRLEQLRVGGARASALVLGSFLASLGLCALLAVVPLLLHGVLSLHGGCDLGQTLSALAALACISCSLAALASCASCWSPHRTAAGLGALALGLSWWIVDLFGHAFDSSGSWSAWRSYVPMASFVHEAAIGLFSPWAAIGHLCAAVCLLYIAGLGIRRSPLPRRLLDALLAIACLVLALGLGDAASRWDSTLHRGHAVAEQTRAQVQSLNQAGGISATLVASPEQRGDPVDQVIIEGCERLLQALDGDGLGWHRLDPIRDPAGAMRIIRKHDLASDALEHPMLLLHHLGRSELLERDRLAQIVDEGASEQRVAALTAENAVLSAMLRLEGRGRQRVAWAMPPLVDDAPLLALRQLFSDAGVTVQDISSFAELDASSQRLLVVHAPRRDPDPDQRLILHDYLRSGGRLLLSLDGRRHTNYAGWRQVLEPYGIYWDDALVGQIESDGQLLPALDWSTVQDRGPLRLLHRDQRPVLLPFVHAAYPGSPSEGELLSLLPVDPQARRWQDGSSEALTWPHAALLCFDGGSKTEDCRIALLAGGAALRDEFLGTAGNVLLAHGLQRWLLTRDDDALLPPRQVLSARYELSASQRFWLTWGLGFGLPLAALLVGLFTQLRRRRTA